MKILIVAATPPEIAPFIAQNHNPAIEVLITGVGITATTFALTRHLLTHTYDLVLQVGVGGSFDTAIPLGSLLFVTSDRFGDLGAEDHDQYLDIFDLGLLSPHETPYHHGALHTPILPIHQSITLPTATGITVNTVSGSHKTIATRSRYACTVESMEGAALHYVCLQLAVPFAQVRSISNYVTPRDKTLWKMKDAIINLNNWLIGFVEKL
jgi:futalosine hydrolase